MKQFFKSRMLWISMFTFIVVCMFCSDKAEAKTYALEKNSRGGSCSLVFDKNKIYYSVTETGSIYCYNIKTGKTTTLTSTKGKGFYNMVKKGNYLYATYDSYGGSDGTNNSIVRISIKTGKFKKLAKGSTFVMSGKKIYFTKLRRVKETYAEYDLIDGVYSMTLTGKKQKPAKNVVINSDHLFNKAIKNSKGSLFTKGETKNGIYTAKTLHFKNKKGKTIKIYDSVKNSADYAMIQYYTLQGNYIVYKRSVKDGYRVLHQLVLVKTNGKNPRVIYSRDAVSGW